MNDLPISSNLPDMVDQYIDQRFKRIDLDHQVEALKEVEEGLKKAIIAKLQEQGATGIGGRLGFAKINEIVEPVALDWLEVQKHIQKTGDFDLLHRRLTNTAVRARWEAGEEVPGVGRQVILKLSISKGGKV